MSEKDLKRAKQAAYASALQQQQSYSKNSSEKAGRARGSSLSPDKRREHSPPTGHVQGRKYGAAGGLEEGWILGPLGL